VDIAERYRSEHRGNRSAERGGNQPGVAHFYKTGLDSTARTSSGQKANRALPQARAQAGTHRRSIFGHAGTCRGRGGRYTESGDPVRYGTQTFRYRAVQPSGASV
jgi:hypothetical protein